MGKSQIERYQELGIEESLELPYRYPIVCKDLSFILRGIYKKLSKDLQLLIFQHSLSAFRLLPLMQTQAALSAANLLIQSAEVVLPKQKKVVAVKEFKQAKICLKKHSKARKERDSPPLPQDVLMHIFGFLDLRSLLSASSVCWAWNSAASDNYLWNVLYTTCFWDTDVEASPDWRSDFREKYEGDCVYKNLHDRGFCDPCNAIVWLSNMNCPNKHSEEYRTNNYLNPVFPKQIVEYVLDGSLSFDSDDDDGDCSEVEYLPGLWAIRVPA